MNGYFKRLGAFLKRKRVEANLSQSEVAHELNYSSPQFISNFERGLCAPPLEKLRILIDMYDIPSSQVVDLIITEQKKHLREKLSKPKTSKSRRSKG